MSTPGTKGKGTAMDASEYRALIAELGLTQVEAARFLGVSDRTSRAWALGQNDVPPAIALFLRYLAADAVTPARVRRVVQAYLDKRG